MAKQQTVKSFALESSAKRALKNIGTAALMAYKKLVKEVDGKFEFILEKAEAIQDAADNAKQDEVPEVKAAAPEKKAAPKKAAKDVPHFAKAKSVTTKPARKVAAVEAEPVVEDAMAGVTAKVLNGTSTVENPCALVWEMAIAMKGARRKDVIAACISKGVAFYTARTQYQLWLTSTKNDAASK